MSSLPRLMVVDLLATAFMHIVLLLLLLGWPLRIAFACMPTSDAWALVPGDATHWWAIATAWWQHATKRHMITNLQAAGLYGGALAVLLVPLLPLRDWIANERAGREMLQRLWRIHLPVAGAIVLVFVACGVLDAMIAWWALPTTLVTDHGEVIAVHVVGASAAIGSLMGMVLVIVVARAMDAYRDPRWWWGVLWAVLGCASFAIPELLQFSDPLHLSGDGYVDHRGHCIGYAVGMTVAALLLLLVPRVRALVLPAPLPGSQLFNRR